MNHSDRSFRERLLKSEQVTPALKERYAKEVQAMFEKKLTGFRRWVWLGAAIMGLGFTILFGAVAVVAPAEFPWYGRLMFAAGALFGIGWAVLGAKIVWRGTMNLKTDTTVANGMGWVFVVLISTYAMVAAPDSLAGLRMIVCSLVFLVGGVAFMTRHVVEQAELKTREKLLEIEYRLAELAETMHADKRVPPQA
jgi:hypothetical protein